MPVGKRSARPTTHPPFIYITHPSVLRRCLKRIATYYDPSIQQRSNRNHPYSNLIVRPGSNNGPDTKNAPVTAVVPGDLSRSHSRHHRHHIGDAGQQSHLMRFEKQMRDNLLQFPYCPLKTLVSHVMDLGYSTIYQKWLQIRPHREEVTCYLENIFQEQVCIVLPHKRLSVLLADKTMMPWLLLLYFFAGVYHPLQYSYTTDTEYRDLLHTALYRYVATSIPEMSQPLVNYPATSLFRTGILVTDIPGK